MKSSKVADSATNQILARCGIHLHCTESAFWPRNVKTDQSMERKKHLKKKCSARQKDVR